MKRVIIFFCILIIVSGMSFALDLFSGPSFIQPGNVFISVGYNSGIVEAKSKYDPMFSGDFNIWGLTLALDYTLQFNCITIGIESGFSSGSGVDKRDYEGYLGFFPVMGRLGYHPDLGVNNLDVYGLFKIGFAIGSFYSNKVEEDDNYFSIGFGLGGRYFFGKVFGVFAELGIDSYLFDSNDYDIITVYKIYTVGIIFKF